MPEARKVPAKKAAAAPTKIDADRFCAEVIAHRHTGKLADIIQAVLKAAGDGPSSLRWQITLDPLGDGYNGRTITEDTFSLPAAVTAERVAGHSWKSLSPTESAEDCYALLLGWLIEDEGMTPPDAEALIRARVNLDNLPDMIGTFEVVHGPKEGGTPSGPSPG